MSAAASAIASTTTSASGEEKKMTTEQKISAMASRVADDIFKGTLRTFNAYIIAISRELDIVNKETKKSYTYEEKVRLTTDLWHGVNPDLPLPASVLPVVSQTEVKQRRTAAATVSSASSGGAVGGGCQYLMKSGANKGKPCGKNTKDGTDRCSTASHSKASSDRLICAGMKAGGKGQCSKPALAGSTFCNIHGKTAGGLAASALQAPPQVIGGDEDEAKEDAQ